MQTSLWGEQCQASTCPRCVRWKPEWPALDLKIYLGIKQLAPVTVLRDEAKFLREAQKVVVNSGKAKGNIEIGLFKLEGESGKYAFFETWKTLADANADNA